ncbi:segregation and condensation protein A [Deinococcus cellulosilyticus]|uniref:Segregation and condensation protein A n=1 Tax=Deinococcus cellulosilyticus (strain DSM 18568 / NBRC 106333 / KACC 11606 / 5516J-15) TaxID=1223518 RepID=A0A511N820_DEIC1|nr:segregation/condensation protein A [Deinococcus cellulosilyticus]GEM48989.1 segregation/condensation protein A [Deinococcus cellulosilyticus NBRC 106333 = KACC 11606]
MEPLTLSFTGFSGGLLELLQALRQERLQPEDVPLSHITEAVLARFYRLRELDAELASEALPQLAAVIALKTSLLLPKIPREEPEDALEDLEDYSHDVLSSVAALQELDALVRFLSEKRRGRNQIIAAKGLNLPYERKKPKEKLILTQLLAAAKSAVREVQAAHIVKDRLTLEDARKAILVFVKNLRRFFFHAITTRDWGERTVYFAALLESVRLGEVELRQDEAYGEIEVEALQTDEMLQKTMDFSEEKVG